MSAWARLGRWLPVLFVTGLIAWCFLVFMLDILIPLLDSPDKAQHDYGLGCTIAFNIIFSLAMISFLRAVFTDPGYIPDSWSVHPDDLESGERTRLMPAVLQTQEKKHDGTVRICRKSKPAMYKPDRAHYCRVMQRCVLKMDHFCPWLNNCIGFYNHKFFVLFVAYMAMITVFMVVVMTPVFVNIVSNMEQITLDLKAHAPSPRPRPHQPTSHQPSAPPPAAVSCFVPCARSIHAATTTHPGLLTETPHAPPLPPSPPSPRRTRSSM
jgi:hypothetical protein